jgi:hypothetical protein
MLFFPLFQQLTRPIPHSGKTRFFTPFIKS